MLEMTYSQLVFVMAVYSIIGWICEVIYCSVSARKFVNRGFLNGPYCPMYGIGAILILTITYPLTSNPLIIFMIAVLVSTVLEYFTGWLMEALFQIRFWDYLNEKFNLKGRICLKNSLLFGLMGLIVTCFLHPFMVSFIQNIPSDRLRVMSSALMAVFLVDLILTLNSMLKLTERLKSLKSLLIDFEEQEHLWFDRSNIADSLKRLRSLAKTDSNKNYIKLLNQLEEIIEKRQWNPRLLKSFPKMKPRYLDTTIDDLRKIWKESKGKLENRKASFRTRMLAFIKNTGREIKTAVKETAETFGSWSGFYKLVWVFVSAGLIGFTLETIYCLINSGVLESRQGFIYGPFSHVYAFGAVLMVLVLTPLAKKGDKWVFFGSAIVGGIFEYACSLFSEAVFNSVSWDHSNQIISIGGRTSVTFMICWGILGLWFIKLYYPWLTRLIKRIPRRLGECISWVLIVVLALDMLISACAVIRWSERRNGLPPSNVIEEFCDENYPDEMLEEIYPNMVFVND